MSDLRTAAQQALGRLRMYYYGTGFAEDAECIAALEAALAQQEEPVEPVAWQWLDTAHFRKKIPADATPSHWRPLYTAPTQRKPLTKEEIMRAFYAAEKTPMSIRHGLSVVEAARIVEKAHGIGEQS